MGSGTRNFARPSHSQLSSCSVCFYELHFFVHSYEPVDSETVRILPRRLVQESYNNGDKIDVKIFLIYTRILLNVD